MLEDQQADFPNTIKQVHQNQMDFDVNLEVFQGPLNLLLYVIEKNEISILDIPIISIIKDYLVYLDKKELTDIKGLSSFLLICSRLMLIKSRNLLPNDLVQEFSDEDNFDSEDSFNELTDALSEIKNYQDIIHELKELESIGHSYHREYPYKYKKITNFEDSLEGVSLEALSELFNKAIVKINEKNQGANHYMGLSEKVSFTQRMNVFTKRLNVEGSVNFFEYISEAISLEQIIVDFLCILTLIKVGYIKVLQDNKFGPISINKSKNVDESILASIVNEF